MSITAIASRQMGAVLLTKNAQSAGYTFALADLNNAVTITSATAVNATIPPNSGVAFPVGAQIILKQGGAGQLQAVAGVGVTVNGSSPFTNGINSVIVLWQSAADVWEILSGNGTGDLPLVNRTASIDETVSAGWGVIVPRKYLINSGKKLIIQSGATFRIL